jgi:curved DNA-binding protein CbpA
MIDLYELLGVRPDDDAEGLKHAFRKAAKASHPDIHAGDPDAPTRFRCIVKAYEILRDQEQRAAYDRLLKSNAILRGPEQRAAYDRLLKSKRTISYTMRNFVSDAIAVAGLAVVLAVVMAGGYTLFAHISRTSVAAVNVVEIPARGPAEIAAVQPAARTDTTDQDEPRDKLADVELPNIATAPSAVASPANSGDALGIANGGPAWSAAGPDTEVARIVAFGAPIDQAEAKTDDDLKKNSGIEPLDQNKALPVGVQFPSLEKDNGVPKSSSSDLTIFDEKHDLKTRDMKKPVRPRMVAKRQATNHTPGKQASSSDLTISDEKHDMKTRDMKKPVRPRMMAKRQATNHTPGKQVSLENRNTSACSNFQTCSGHVPPLFGVGF